ncbi:VWA domain-containing protein [Cellulomonas carbonis]|nr:VWA domain-containing protein [Cellulomonas carbonis]GGC05855.1 hypothetical protein GCM10010972_18810 [Cellulomonas carbonis]
MRLHRLRTTVTTVALAALVAAGLPTAAGAGTPSWRDALGVVAQDPDTVHTRAYAEQAIALLTPVVDDAAGTGHLAALAADLDSLTDGARFATADDGAATYAHLHDLGAWLESGLAGSASATDPRAEGLVLVVRAARVAADVAVGDLRGVLDHAPATTPGRAAAERALRQAEQQLALADAAMGRSAASSVVVHLRNAWTKASGGLTGLGVEQGGDHDGDGVPDALELGLGTSPFSADTDGDGLSDRFEVETLFGFSSPALADTDADGVADGQEDLDGDGLDALAEQAAGTSPTEGDTDADRLGDADELAAGTDPLTADTDADGLVDGAEGPAGTDALDPDSDDDGVLDGADVTTQQVDALDGIHVALVGTGDLAGGLVVHEVTADGRLVGAGGQVGRAYDFSLAPPVADGLQQARLTLPFPADLGDAQPEDLRVFYFDPEIGAWYPAAEDQVVDVAAGTVTATVTHFSTYAIFDIRNWGETWTAQDDPCRPRGGGGGTDIVLLDLALVLDSSGSMSWNDPQGLRRSAAKIFVDALLPEDRAAVVDFDSSARVAQGLTEDKAAVKSAIDTIDDVGGTNIGAGVSAANQILLGNGDPARARMVILLTDGEGSYSSSLTTQAQAAGITIYTIGLGSSVDHALLGSIATGTGGTYTNVRTAEELPEVFRRLAEDTGGSGADLTKDTDSDGVPDCIEIQGALSGSGHRYTSDPAVADTDGDGLTDGEEIGSRIDADFFGTWIPGNPTTAPTYAVFSDPDSADTDGDGLTDAVEADLETSPFSTDSDGDGERDGVEVEVLGTSPILYDTDGDSFSDGYEDDHRHDQGLDPLYVDVKVSAWTYAGHFAQGFIAGDLWRADSLAWLAGNLLSGGLSFIPVYGWIAGGVADLRDVIGSAIHADWVGAGMSLAGVVPYAGDAFAIPGKAVRFVLRNTDKADEALTLVAKMDEVPDSIKVDAARQILKDQWDVLIDEGFDQASLIRIMAGRGNLDQVAQAVGRAANVTVGAGFKATGKAGEAALEATYGATTKGVDKQVWFSTKGILGRGRYADVFVNGIAHESKVGFVSYSRSIRNQIEKDAALVANGRISGAHWHFYASDVSSSIGADPRIIDLLVQKGIPFTVHAP